MNAVEAIKRANAFGSDAMLHACTLTKRRDSTAEQLATWNPALVIGIGLLAGAVFGKAVANHPKLSGAGAFALTLLRAAPADTLWRMWGGSDPGASA